MKSIKNRLKETQQQLEKVERKRGSFCGLGNDLSKEVIELKAKETLLSDIVNESKIKVNKAFIFFMTFLLFNLLFMWIPVFSFKIGQEYSFIIYLLELITIGLVSFGSKK